MDDQRASNAMHLSHRTSSIGVAGNDDKGEKRSSGPRNLSCDTLNVVGYGGMLRQSEQNSDKLVTDFMEKASPHQCM